MFVTFFFGLGDVSTQTRVCVVGDFLQIYHNHGSPLNHWDNMF